ncbi:DUF7701 domain-containing protein [Nocardia sp. CA-120079]|uniref:DUF7701 domain-containing protein n=1 Tax=Nocardia sp. CA-120079 TaxID=3239974 RepID=UPI003D983840
MTYLGEIAHRIRNNLPIDATPPTDSDFLFLIYAVLVRAKGELTTLEDVHDAWAAWMQTVKSDHDALVPFKDLARTVQDEDIPYLEAIRRTALELRTTNQDAADSPPA